MSEHTPGPWEWTKDSLYEFYDGIKATAGEFVLEAMTGCCSEGYATFDGLDISEANACLIAAAPELLEALKALLTSDAIDRGSVGSQAAWNAARAAIAKAEGRDA